MLHCKSLESGWDWFSQCAGYGRVTVTVNMRTLIKLKAKLRGYQDIYRETNRYVNIYIVQRYSKKIVVEPKNLGINNRMKPHIGSILSYKEYISVFHCCGVLVG